MAHDPLPAADLPALLRACEAEPSPVPFMAMADWYLAAGDEKMFQAWMWMYFRDNWPYRVTTPREEWDWYCEGSTTANGPLRHYLPAVVYDAANHTGLRRAR